jgi:Flp pilus assembly protein TadG
MIGRWSSGDSGSLVVELVVLTPVVFIIALCTLVFGRVSNARQLVTESARAGAQAASLMPNAESAQSAAADSAEVGTGSQAHTCVRAQVVTDVSHYYPGGYVRVTVTCAVAFSDLSVPGVPGSTNISESSTAPVDPYRSVQP